MELKIIDAIESFGKHILYGNKKVFVEDILLMRTELKKPKIKTIKGKPTKKYRTYIEDLERELNRYRAIEMVVKSLINGDNKEV